MMNIYNIEYICYASDGRRLAHGKIRAKNMRDSIEAQVEFEKFLKRRHKDFGRLEVISCKEDLPEIFSEMFGNNNSNPFNF